MPPKQRVIKSIGKSDPLTLACEWGECFSVFNDMEKFQLHITSHLQELDPDGTFEENGQLVEDAVDTKHG